MTGTFMEGRGDTRATVPHVFRPVTFSGEELPRPKTHQRDYQYQENEREMEDFVPKLDPT